MNSNSNTAVNILHLPLEVLEEIISYVPDQFTVAQTCKAFYNISCRHKSYKITISSVETYNRVLGVNVEELEENESLLQSIVKSRRKIAAITLFDINMENLKYHRSLKVLFKRFGHNLSELTLNRSQLGPRHFVGGNVEMEKFQLDLPNLRELTIDGRQCVEMSKVLKVFNDLPDNILIKVVVKECVGSAENVLRNQKKIKEITWDGSEHFPIDTRNSELLTLSISEQSYSKELLTNLRSLTSLTLPFKLKQADIDTISLLEQLEHLKFEIGSFLNLSALQKLSKLVKIDVKCAFGTKKSLQTLKNFSLGDLIMFFPDFDYDLAVTLPSNCPKIRKLTLFYPKFDWMCYNTPLEKLPELEYFSINIPPTYLLPRGFVHYNLKRLELVNILNTSIVRAILESCISLETFETSKIFWELLNILLTARPNLRNICANSVQKFDEKFIRTFFLLGGNIKSFHIKSKSSISQFEMLINEKMREIDGGLPYLALMKAFRAYKSCCKK